MYAKMPALGGLADEGPVLYVQNGDDRTRRLVHDAIDELQRLVGALVHDHHGHVRALGGRDARDIREAIACDDVVSEVCHVRVTSSRRTPGPSETRTRRRVMSSGSIDPSDGTSQKVSRQHTAR